MEHKWHAEFYWNLSPRPGPFRVTQGHWSTHAEVSRTLKKEFLGDT